jgi:hypothetical protein
MPRRSVVVPFVLAASLAALVAPLAAQTDARPAPPSATLGLGDDLPWRTDGQEFHEREPRGK